MWCGSQGRGLKTRQVCFATNRRCWSKDPAFFDYYLSFTFLLEIVSVTFLKGTNPNSRAFLFTEPTCRPSDFATSSALTFLRDDPRCLFKVMIDLCERILMDIEEDMRAGQEDDAAA